ncbi:FMN-binding protein [Prevotella sp. kh1p2]|uniref:FMN-binding protein n=1 Tax=Prevotella sp. kh1p2 TaxID=1761883 RepID=UPI0008D3420E|nr:FMN-binding protein [Prevotella sp. kh1p2]SET02310.1 electron transport complex protein RnfG [Prevotella sp. kh1p2]SNU11406.1 electron transport complex protein RnfG [Prevotellaceae bacterium KH2P17]
MDKKIYKRFAGMAAVLAAGLLISAMPAENVMQKDGDTTIVNTQQLGKNVRGYRGATPLKIYIRKNKVVKVEPLANHETPKFFAKAKTLLAKYEGASTKKAAKMQVDGVSGATFTSKALKKNMELGLQYYNEHK